jgi:hypothetical protein
VFSKIGRTSPPKVSKSHFKFEILYTNSHLGTPDSSSINAIDGLGDILQIVEEFYSYDQRVSQVYFSHGSHFYLLVLIRSSNPHSQASQK